MTASDNGGGGDQAEAVHATPAAVSAPDDGRGAAIIRSSWIGTAVFLVAVSVAAPLPAARLPAAIVDLALFLGGCGVFMVGLALAVVRSRERNIDLWNLSILEGVAPRRVRRAILGALGVEVVAALATAWISAALAFGILVPMWALGHGLLWGARHGDFTPRQPQDRRRRRGSNG